jgi:hypothetical protein
LEQKYATYLTWITKALLMRGHPMGMFLGNFMIEHLLPNAALGQFVANLLGELLANVDDAKQWRDPTAVLFWKQKFLTKILPTVLTGSKAGNSKLNFTVALAKILVNFPLSIFKSELSTVRQPSSFFVSFFFFTQFQFLHRLFPFCSSR